MTSGRYATDTRVSVERSKAEIEAILARYGADQFMYGWEASRAVIGFRYSGKMVRFILALPTPESDAFILTPTGKRAPLRPQRKSTSRLCDSDGGH